MTSKYREPTEEEIASLEAELAAMKARRGAVKAQEEAPSDPELTVDPQHRSPFKEQSMKAPKHAAATFEEEANALDYPIIDLLIKFRQFPGIKTAIADLLRVKAEKIGAGDYDDDVAATARFR